VAGAADEPSRLRELIDEGLQKQPGASRFEYKFKPQAQIPQAKALPHPMFMFGYQNEGSKKSRWAKSQILGHIFTFADVLLAGQRDQREMAARDAESLAAMFNAAKLRLQRGSRTLLRSLLAYKTIDIQKERSDLFRHRRRSSSTVCLRYGLAAGL
jgi:outer membrane protein TolC